MSGKLKLKDIEDHIRNMKAPEALEHLLLLKNEQGLHLDKLIMKYEKRKAACDKEMARLSAMSEFERYGYKNGYSLIAGIDEAGRGPLAGPVVAAAVILPPDIIIEHLNDSKQLSAKQRESLYDIILENAVSYGIGMVDEKCIDEINILNATVKAMSMAIEALKPRPDLLLVDAVKLDEVKIEQIHIVKGDCKSVSIAAASIIAKVTRDRLIDKYDSIYPEYGFAKHKGYGTADHIKAIKKYGICPIHRVSFTKNFVS